MDSKKICRTALVCVLLGLLLMAAAAALAGGDLNHFISDEWHWYRTIHFG